MDLKDNKTTPQSHTSGGDTSASHISDAKLYVIISILVILGAFVVACMISFLSEFGKHPDEYDVRACMDWCMTRWIWPDMRLMGTGLGDTFSGYGYTKVCNYTPYFLIFSKIAAVFKIFMENLPYFRKIKVYCCFFTFFLAFSDFYCNFAAR